MGEDTNRGSIVVFQEDSYKKIADILKKSAKTRRAKKTPKRIVKKREGGSDESGRKIYFDYVDRPEYQRFLDEEFPGWSAEIQSAWTEKATLTEQSGYSQEYPITFNISVLLKVIDNGIVRHISGIGTATVSSKEIRRENSSMLKQKFNSAYTEAIKSAANWLGAFYDLRADENERSSSWEQPGTNEIEEFNKLCDKVIEGSSSLDEETREKTIQVVNSWKKTFSSLSLKESKEFIKQIKDKMKDK